MPRKLEYGVLLPHFGSQARPDRILEGSRFCENSGFDSVWVRDHLVFHPHQSEDPDRTFLDPFVVLSAVAGVTSRVILGTAALIPHRNPVHTALLVGSLDFLAGPNRIVLGMGLGSFDHEFAAAGMSGWDRRIVIEEQVDVMRKLWTGQEVTHSGTYYKFEDTDVHPSPAAGNVPIWYLGTSPASVRRAVEYCEGWMPGRMPLFDYTQRIKRMTRLSEEAGRELPRTGTIPYVVTGKNHEEAVANADVPALLSEASRKYKLADGSAPSELADLDGAVIVGNPDEVLAGVRRCQDAGADHFIFDLRLRFKDWEDALAEIGEEILPILHREDGR
jgi:probable F420-dependent oxidoreductase